MPPLSVAVAAAEPSRALNSLKRSHESAQRRKRELEAGRANVVEALAKSNLTLPANGFRDLTTGKEMNWKEAQTWFTEKVEQEYEDVQLDEEALDQVSIDREQLVEAACRRCSQNWRKCDSFNQNDQLNVTTQRAAVLVIIK